MKKGPKYRLPKKINWDKNRDNIVQFLENYSDNWVKKEKKTSGDRNLNTACLKNWRDEILRLVDGRILKGKNKPRSTSSHYIKGVVKDCLDQLHEKYVMTPADKAQNNILFTCKPFYI